jgi:Rhs element Vgr protein
MSVPVDYIGIASFTIKVDGKALDTALQRDLTSIAVDSNLQLPDMVTLQFYGADTTVVDAKTFDVGKSIEVTVVDITQPNEPVITLFKGEISALEPVFTEGGYVQVVVRGYDKTHRLHRGKKTRTFANKKVSDIVSQIAGDAGLQADVDATQTTHPHIWQNNQTDMEFLRGRAHRLNYFLYADDQKLYFKKMPPSSGRPIELTWQRDLRSFRPRMSAAHQVNKVIVRSWDPKKKDVVEGQATSPSSTDNQGGVSEGGGNVAKKAFSAAETVVVSYPQIEGAEAKTIAQGVLDRLHDGFVQAEGTCVGNPHVKAGKVVKIVDVGTRFSGTYVVTQATHTFSTEGNYETTFHVRGRHADILTHMLQGNGHQQAERGLINGVVPAIVTNNNDDEDKAGRVKVKFPWLNDEVETDWIRFAAPGAGKTRGFYSIPEVDDEVLVAFEHGDINRPYVVGGLWNGKDAPPKPTNEVVASGKVNERIWQSRSGHVILMSDEEGKEQIVIRDKTGKNEIIVDSKENAITVNVDGNYTVNSGGDALVNSEGDATLTSKGKTTTDSKGDITIKTGSANVTVQGSKVTIKGQSAVAIEAQGKLDLKSSGQLNLQGAQVAIKGSAMVQIQGAMVKIN